MLDITTGKDLNAPPCESMPRMATEESAGHILTRRDFIGGGIAAASMVGLAGSANASVRRGLGARLAANFAGGGGGWVNPYVADGLVAMWDGEWDVGGGLSSESSSISEWTDIIGGRKVVSSYLIPHSNNGVGPCNQSGNKYGLYLSQDYRHDIVLQLNESTFEIVISCPNIEVTANNGMSFALSDTFFIQTNTSPTSAGCGINAVGTYYGMNYTPNTSCARSITVDRSLMVNFYGNGSYVATMTGNTPMSDTTYNWTRSYFGIFCPQILNCFRIYSRTLSASEIAANFAVDAARFGIT